MEVDEKPTEVYSDIGGLNQQIEELVEAVVLPMQQQEKFKTLGIKPPKGRISCFHLVTNRCSYVWSTWNWKDTSCSSMRGSK
jgi:hypothetical protein